MIEHSTFLPRRENKCKSCPLYDSGVKSRHVPTELVQIKPPKEGKKPRIDILFVGEAPGENEDRQCRPFIGKSGQFVRKIIKKYATTNYAVTNRVRCRPTDKNGQNRQPTPEERSHCEKYLWEDVENLKPKKIIALGGVASGAFINDFRSISSIRGQELKVKSPNGFDTVVIPTYHPAARDTYSLTFIPKDIREAFSLEKAAKNWGRPGKTILLTSVKKIKRFCEFLLKGLPKKSIVAVDVETYNGLNRIDNRLISIAFSWDGKTGYSFPLDHPKAPWSPEELNKIKKYLRKLFSEKPRFKYWLAHNAKFEIQQLHTYLGVWVRHKFLDTQHIAFLLDENRLKMRKEMEKGKGPFSLKHLSAEHFNLAYEDEEILGARNSGLIRTIKWKKVCNYNGEDAWKTRRLLYKFKLDAGDYWPKALRLSDQILAPATLMFAVAEINGFKIDLDRLFELQAPNSELQKAMRAIDASFREDPNVRAVNKKIANQEAGGMTPLFGNAWVFNPDKREHLIALFLKRMKLKPIGFSKKTKEPSLNSEFWNTYEEAVPLAKAMNERQEIKKLVSSYLNQIRDFLEHDPDCKDGRVRSSFHLDRTVTGRTASTDPNLQQIPKADSPYKKATKNIFTVEPGNVLVSIDFSQGEVYLMAQTTKDHTFAKMLWKMQRIKDAYWEKPTPELKMQVVNECDTHRQSAALMNDIPVAEVTKDQRQSAKAIVTFGLIYGKHHTSLARDLGKTDEEALGVQKKFFQKFPESEKGLIRLEEMAKKYHHVESDVGRRRRLPQVLSQDKGEVNRALRQARNSPIQSLLSDLTLFQAARLNEYILDRDLKWKIIDVVHDAVIAEIPFREVRRYCKVSKRILMDVKTFADAFNIEMLVPMTVDFEVGLSYGNLQELESWTEGEKSLRALLKNIKREWKRKGYSYERKAA